MQHEKQKDFPTGALWAAAAVLAVVISLAATARWSGIGASHVAKAPASRSVELLFKDRNDGGIDILRASDNRVIDVLAPGSNGFVRTVMRGLARDRRLHNEGPDTPFRLTQWANGALSMEDPATGRRIELKAFGAPNAASFARLMTAEGVIR
jgi:putative photosynthetic complex assembly protein